MLRKALSRFLGLLRAVGHCFGLGRKKVVSHFLGLGRTRDFLGSGLGLGRDFLLHLTGVVKKETQNRRMSDQGGGGCDKRSVCGVRGVEGCLVTAALRAS